MSRDGTLAEQLVARLRELEGDTLDGLPRRPGGWSPRRRAEAGRATPGSGRRGSAEAAGEPRAAVSAARPGVGTSPAGGTSPVGGGDSAGAPAPAVRGGSAVGAGSAGDAWRALPLAELGAWLADCGRCRLAEGRTQVVFGVGDPEARLMFVGEGPGRDEDLQGEPFVGKAGRLLTDMIEKGLKLRREQVYIANVVKCRPPDNRDPDPEEVEACGRFLRRQVELVQPEVIVALGRFAAQTLLESRTPVSKLRGRWHDYHGTPLMPTFHPAYLLRTPADKRLAWEDLKKVIERLGL